MKKTKEQIESELHEYIIDKKIEILLTPKGKKVKRKPLKDNKKIRNLKNNLKENYK